MFQKQKQFLCQLPEAVKHEHMTFPVHDFSEFFLNVLAGQEGNGNAKNATSWYKNNWLLDV